MNTDKFLVREGAKLALKKHTTDFTGDYTDKKQAEKDLARNIERLGKLQDVMYAQDVYSLLIIFQAMDAAGKDGAIEHVMSGVNPQGCHVTSFKQPSTEELDHDFLWRTSLRTPSRGTIGIFNRSYYEEVLVVRVHPEILERQHLPKACIDKHAFRNRYEHIAAYERYLTRNGIVIRKFFLNVSKAEQKRRFLARIDEPEKNWKFSVADAREREYWNDYQDAYERMI